MEYRGDSEGSENLVLMNRARQPQPHHGALTDLQVWDRVLSPAQVSAWISCQAEPSQTQGNIVSWERVESQLNISTSLNMTNLQRSETCYRDNTQTRKSEWCTIIGWDPSRYCALIGCVLMLCQKDTGSQSPEKVAFLAFCSVF